MSVLSEITAHGHEQVVFFQENTSYFSTPSFSAPGAEHPLVQRTGEGGAAPGGLVAIVAIHDTTLGPALGGCRMHAYGSLEEALYDVLRLSEGMTFKNSLAGLNLGGGKAVIVQDRALQEGRVELFRKFGGWVSSLGGRYITAEDMGTSVSDMTAVLECCSHVAGKDPALGGGGDPSPWTALGVFCGMRACLERVYGAADFTGRTVAVQGAGHVGNYLVGHLVKAGAKVVVADTRAEPLEHVRKSYDVEVVSPKDIAEVQCDIFAPCAMGSAINPDTVGAIKCKIVAGAANNQLSDARIEGELARRGIVYAPDFAINAGGVIMCADEFEPGGYTESRVRSRVERIYETVGAVLDRAKSSGQSTAEVAIQLAKERIVKAKQGK